MEVRLQEASRLVMMWTEAIIIVNTYFATILYYTILYYTIILHLLFLLRACALFAVHLQ